jgi:acyl carrier protein
MTHPGIREAAVVLSGAGRARRLIGYVVQTANAAIGLESEVRGFLRTQLPEPMLPTDFVWLDALPLTPSGKVDRRALPSPEVCSRNSDAAFRAPRTEVEQRLAAIWSKVLGRERIAVTDDFFELGGHSLLATQLVSRIRSAFGKEVSLRQVFESPTLEDLALVLGELRSRTPGDGLLEYREGGASSGSNRAEPSGTRDSR